MKTIVLYASKYGSTQQYAEWLCDEIKADLCETTSCTLEQARSYDQIILGGSIFASGIKDVKWLTKNYPHLKDKRIAVFAVGASPYSEEGVEEIRQHVKLEDSVPLFYLRGRWDEPNMSWLDRKMCGVLKKQLEKKPADELVPWEQALIDAYEQNGGEATSWMSKEQLDPLVAWAHE